MGIAVMRSRRPPRDGKPRERACSRLYKHTHAGALRRSTKAIALRIKRAAGRGRDSSLRQERALALAKPATPRGESPIRLRRKPCIGQAELESVR